MVAAAILIPAFAVAIWGAFKVRKDDALNRHMYIYSVATGFIAFGLALEAGYGLVGLVLFPVGFLVGILDSYLKIFNWPL